MTYDPYQPFHYGLKRGTTEPRYTSGIYRTAAAWKDTPTA